MNPDRPDEPDEPSDRQNRGSAEDPAVAAGPPRAETRSRTEYYVDLRLADSAEKSAAAEEASAAEHAAAQQWQEESAESRSMWEEFQEKWPPREQINGSGAARFPETSLAERRLDQAIAGRVEAECGQIARRERDSISPALRSIESMDPERHLIGFEHRLKGHDRIAEKVHDGVKFLKHSPEEAVSLVPDAIRYTFQYREGHYTQGVWSDMSRLKEEGFELKRLGNYWSNDQYKGINSHWIEPETGQRFEVQFHTHISFEAKQLTHNAYERLRTGQADKLEELVLEAFQRKVTAKVPVPPGADDISSYPERL